MMHEEEEHQARVEAMIGGAIKGTVKYEVFIGGKPVAVETKLTTDKARAMPHAHEHARTRTNTHTHTQHAKPNNQVQHFEYCLEPQKLEKWRAAVRAEWGKVEAKADFAAAEKKRKRAKMELALAALEVEENPLQSSQSFSSAEEPKEPAKEKTTAAAAESESAAAAAESESTATADSSRLMQAAAGVARVAVNVAERSGLI